MAGRVAGCETRRSKKMERGEGIAKGEWVMKMDKKQYRGCE